MWQLVRRRAAVWQVVRRRAAVWQLVRRRAAVWQVVAVGWPSLCDLLYPMEQLRGHLRGHIDLQGDSPLQSTRPGQTS